MTIAFNDVASAADALSEQTICMYVWVTTLTIINMLVKMRLFVIYKEWSL